MHLSLSPSHQEAYVILDDLFMWCTEYHYGVKVKRRAHTVEWRDAEKVGEGYSKRQTFQKKHYSFNRTQYEAIQDKCLAYLHHIVYEREINGRPGYVRLRPKPHHPMDEHKSAENSIKRYKECLPYNIRQQELNRDGGIDTIPKICFNASTGLYKY